MMEPFEPIDIQELPLSVPSVRRQVEDFLGSNGLRLEEVDLYQAVLSPDGSILAGGGLRRDLIKCVAVSAAARSAGLSVPLISSLISAAAARGFTCVKVFTKPANRAVFESLGFRLLAEAPQAILLENGRGLETYCAYLRAHPAPGVIVMNANPFTRGHRYLVEQAVLALGPSTGSGTERVSDGEPVERVSDGELVGGVSDGELVEPPKLTIIPVKEDASRFSYAERLAMIRAGAGDWADVVEGSDYQISAATFPTYFLKDLSDAAETQMRLDIDLFGRHIAPALGARVRFVGSEPADPLTARYNALMKELLPAYGVEVVEIQRFAAPVISSVVAPVLSSETAPVISSATVPAISSETAPVISSESTPVVSSETTPVISSETTPVISSEVEKSISASTVRTLLASGHFTEASALTPVSTWPYLLANLAERALRLELDTPLKPGLVGPDSTGAHTDMDHGLMRKGIAAIRPFFPCMALAETPEELRQLGIDAEAAMLAATGGVNTHRGAIFALGLALNAAYGLMRSEVDGAEDVDTERLMQIALRDISQRILCKSLNDSELSSTASSHGSEAVRRYGVKGARELALEGYEELFGEWLPYYRSFEISPLASLGRNDKETTLGRNDKETSLGRNTSCHLEPSREICTLLRIMSTLDDTCVLHRVGYERAMEVKEEAGALLREIPGQAGNDEKAGNDGKCQAGNDDTVMAGWTGRLKELCGRYREEGISPGGAADMLALTIFMDSIFT